MRASDGMVRCGRCREVFRADVRRDGDQAKFDPKRASIEPLSEQNEDAKSLNEASNYTTKISIEYASEVDPEGSLDSGALSVEEIVANINAKQERQRELSKDAATQGAVGLVKNQLRQSRPPTSDDQTEQFKQAELDISNTKSSLDALSQDESLIDQMDALIDDKLMSPNALDKAPPQKKEDRFELDPKTPRSASRRWFRALLALLLMFIVVVLMIALIYQAWLKQWLVFDSNTEIERWFSKTSIQVNQLATDRGITLPNRRNLSRLELLSAKVEPHPSRSSTTLLRVSLINHAEISQALPWLELSLFDKEGKLVARRQLPPRDYLYNNATSQDIGARELKKFSIELLTFPKSATGYELKVLNR